MIIAITFLVVWVVCGLYTVGVTVAHWTEETQNTYDYREILGLGVLLAALGPVGAFMVTCLSGFLKHGWRLR